MKLRINNKEYGIEVAPQMPLLWVLRDVLGLNGTKYSCGIGQCGACSVHLDGKVVRSCTTPVSTVKGREITTIEGIGQGEEMHPVQTTWKSLDVPQCGYCQSGQIMSAVALLNENANPSDEEIDEAMQGNLCRCGTYVRIRKAVKAASGKLD